MFFGICVRAEKHVVWLMQQATQPESIVNPQNIAAHADKFPIEAVNFSCACKWGSITVMIVSGPVTGEYARQTRTHLGLLCSQTPACRR